MTLPYSSNSARTRQGGVGATHKQDFVAHTDGSSYRHTATHIDLANSIPGLSATQVQQALEELASGGTEVSTDHGFISIGPDGYTPGTYTVGAQDTPTLAAALTAAFANPRLANGGVILLMAGRYTLTTTVSVPAGITLMGEVAGTYISGNMASPTSPMFLVQNPSSYYNIGGNSGSGVITAANGSNISKTKFFNLVLIDNFNGTAPTMTSAGMIHVQKGSTFEAERVSFFGRLTNGAILNRVKTVCAIATVSGNISGTSISLDYCYIDGVRNGVLFGTSAGDLDFLSITNTKGRWYGTEAVSFSAKTDCFVDTTLCNVNIADCYLVGAGNHASLILNLGNTGGTTNTLRYSIIGVRGNGGAGTAGRLIGNDSSVSSLRGIISGNSWGGHIQNEWFVVVGSSANATGGGDVFGSGALDLLLNLNNTGNFSATIIVNSGNYSINGSSNPSNNFLYSKIIGNPIGASLPIIDVDLSNQTDLDILGQPQLLLGNYLENLQFTCTGNTHSIRPSHNSSRPKWNLTIKNCYFKNITVNIFDINDQPEDFDSVSTSISTLIDGCTFFQAGGTRDDTISLVAPESNICHIVDCFFFGGGYPIAIGGSNYPSAVSLSESHCILENVKTDMSGGYTIGNLTPGNNPYSIYVASDKIDIINSSFLVSDTLNAINSAIENSVANSGEYEGLISAVGDRITIKGSLFNGPNQVYPVSSFFYAMKTLDVRPNKSLEIEGCKFIGGPTACHIGSTLNNATVQESIIIRDNSFISTGGATESVSQTLLDIDIDSTGTVANNVYVVDNNFIGNCITNPFRTQHTFNTGSSFITTAAAQLYAKGCNIYCKGNSVRTELNTLQDADPSDCYSGIVINTFTSDAGTSSFVTSAQVSNNIVKIQSNNTSSGSAASVATCISVLTNLLTLVDNDLNMHNATVNSSFAGCLALDVRLLGGSGKGVVRGNHLGRAPVTGSITTSLSRGYIYIPSTNTYRGMIVENNFDSQTFNGSSNVLIEDNSTLSSRKWYSNKNINEIKTLICNGAYGTVSVDTGNVFTGLSAAGFPQTGAADSSAMISDESLTRTVAFNYGTGSHGNTVIYKWSIPVSGLIPDGASVIALSVAVDLTVNASSSAVCALQWIENAVATALDNNLSLNTSGDTLAVSGLALGLYRSNGSLSQTIDVLVSLNSSSNTTATIAPLTITYTY